MPVSQPSFCTSSVLIVSPSDRYDNKMIPEQPDVLVNPKFEDLFMHCTQEHPTIWEDLRHRRDLEPLASPPPS